MGSKTITMKWNLCSSPPWVPFHPYTMFQIPIPRPSCQKPRKTIITIKVLVTQSSNIVHCDQHAQKPIHADIQAFPNISIPTKHICADFQAFPNTFSLYKYTFFCRSLVFSGTVHWFEGRQAFIHYCGLHQV